MTHSFKRRDWLIKKRNTNALLVIMGTERAVKSVDIFIYSAGNFSMKSVEY